MPLYELDKDMQLVFLGDYVGKQLSITFNCICD